MRYNENSTVQWVGVGVGVGVRVSTNSGSMFVTCCIRSSLLVRAPHTNRFDFMPHLSGVTACGTLKWYVVEEPL